ncbi:hypothetical protein PV328_012460, partial [Microctonus aethiopoides]
IANLYPEVQLPVSRGTPMISPLIKWDHSDDWYVTSYKVQDKITLGERTVEVTLTDEDYEYMAGHVIDGQNLLPVTGYLALVWQTVGMMKGKLYTEVSVVFQDVKFLRATTLPKEEKINPPLPDNNETEMSSRDFYKELRLRGYNYDGSFKGVKSATISGSKGKIVWTNNWVTFMDNMIQIQFLGIDSRSLCVPTGIQKLVIDTKAHLNQIRSMTNNKEFFVYNMKTYDLIVAGGVEIRGLKASAISRRKRGDDPVLESYKYVAHRDRAKMSLKEAVH